MHIPKMLRGVVGEAKRRGFTVGHTRAGHIVLRKPGRPPIFMSSTPSDQRCVQNARGVLRRIDDSCEAWPQKAVLDARPTGD